MFAGLADAAVFTHGIALSALPDALVRLLATVMIASSAAATATAASLIGPDALEAARARPS